MPIDALAALIATGFFENTESTWPVATIMSVSRPSRPFTSMLVFERMRKASAPTTTTAWLSPPVEMRSPSPTGVPTRAAAPLTVAVPRSWFTPGGMSPFASARAITAAAPPNAMMRSHVRLRSSIPASRFSGEHDVEDAVPEAAPALLEFRLRPRRRPRREAARGVGEPGHGLEERQHLVGIVAPIGRHVQDAAGREPGGGELDEIALQQAPLVVALLRPRV